jgi:hypothetical protein
MESQAPSVVVRARPLAAVVVSFLGVKVPIPERLCLAALVDAWTQAFGIGVIFDLSFWCPEGLGSSRSVCSWAHLGVVLGILKRLGVWVEPGCQED